MARAAGKKIATKVAAKKSAKKPAAKGPDPAALKQAAAVKAVIESQRGATGSSLPSAPGVTLYKIMGKMFAILATRKTYFVVLRSDPHLIELLKQQYKGIGHRTHLDKRFWIAVDLGSDVPMAEMRKLIAHSHALIAASLTKKQQTELATLP